MRVPFNIPSVSGREFALIQDAIARGQLSGDGHYSTLCRTWLSAFTGAHDALLTHSCTAALEMASILLGIGPGDEVIMPSYTFVSTANAVALRGGVPVFVDIRRDTLNIDETLIEAAITPRTRAIYVVHYAGVMCEMDAIRDIARKHGLATVEDAAHAFGSTYKGRPAGSLGDMAAFSFHETKNIISGEGGAILFRDATYLKRAEIIREKGTNRSQFFRGQTDKYTWVDIGSSYLPGELIASFLYGQLEKADEIQTERMNNWLRYEASLRKYHNSDIGLPFVPAHCAHNAHLFYLLLPSLDIRQEMIRRLREDQIVAPFHYIPLHSSPAGKRFGRSVGQLSVTDTVSERLLRLPLYPRMGDAIDRVIDRVSKHIEDII